MQSTSAPPDPGERDESSSKPTSKPTGPTLDRIQKLIGAYGKFQLLVCLAVYLSKFPIAWHQLKIIFLNPRMSYHCGDPKIKNTCPCAHPVWDTSTFKTSIKTEWNLICKKEHLASFVQMIFQWGTLVGSICFGMASDRFGRRRPFIVACAVQMVFGFVAAYLTIFWTFLISNLILGITVGGTMVIGFVIIMEYVGAQHREVMAAVYQVPFVLGHLTLPLMAYFFRDFRHFQLAIAVPTCWLLLYFIFLPETPRWLIAVRKIDKAIKALERAARMNGRPTDNFRPEVEAYLVELERQSLRKGTVVDLFRTPNIRKNIICMAFNWFSCSYTFYGTSQFVGELSGNVFLNVAGSATIVLIGLLLSIPLMKVTGRRTVLIAGNFICASSLLSLAAIPEGTYWAIGCAWIGCVSSFVIFSLVYLYCSELFPTVVRNAALGFSSMMARVGSMIAPFVVPLRPKWVPALVFAIPTSLAFFVSFFLPETKGCGLMTTLEEGEAFGKKQPKRSPQPRPAA